MSAGGIVFKIPIIPHQKNIIHSHLKKLLLHHLRQIINQPTITIMIVNSIINHSASDIQLIFNHPKDIEMGALIAKYSSLKSK
jgi:hypothetical protein